MEKLYKFEVNFSKHTWSISEVEVVKETEKRFTLKDKSRAWIDKDRLDVNISHFDVVIYSATSDLSHFKAVLLPDMNKKLEEINYNLLRLNQHISFIKGLN